MTKKSKLKAGFYPLYQDEFKHLAVLSKSELIVILFLQSTKHHKTKILKVSNTEISNKTHIHRETVGLALNNLVNLSYIEKISHWRYLVHDFSQINTENLDKSEQLQGSTVSVDNLVEKVCITC